MRVTLIYNLKAGQGQITEKALRRLLTRSGYEVIAQSVKSREFPAALGEPADLVAVAGGDGSVARVLRKLPDRRVPVAILPVGVANNFARSFGIAGSLEEMIAGWRRAKVRKLDLFEAGGVWGRRRLLEGVGCGAVSFGMANSRGLSGSREEKLATARVNIARAVKRTKPKRCRIIVDGKSTTGDFLLLEVMNISHLGPGIRLSANGAAGDGKLDVMTVGASERDRDAMVDWLERCDASDPPVTRLVSGRVIELVCEGGPVRVDDAFHEPKGEVRARIEPLRQTARILVPAPPKKPSQKP
jgi:diacylglycerol kinase family enzyme